MTGATPASGDRVSAMTRLDPSTRAVLRAREGKVVASARAANGAFADPAEALLVAMIALVEARAAWEHQRARALAVHAAHASAAQDVEAPTLPLPNVGPWLLADHIAISEALTSPRLTRRQAAVLPGHVDTFVGNWVRGIEMVRHRRDPARSRLAAAS